MDQRLLLTFHIQIIKQEGNSALFSNDSPLPGPVLRQGFHKVQSGVPCAFSYSSTTCQPKCPLIYSSLQTTANFTAKSGQKEIGHKLHEDLNQLSAWSKQWLLDFSVEKCSMVRVKSRIKHLYFVKGKRLYEVSQQKYRMCSFNRLPEVIINLYISLIRPILEYYSPLWSPWLKKGHRSPPQKKTNEDAKNCAKTTSNY